MTAVLSPRAGRGGTEERVAAHEILHGQQRAGTRRRWAVVTGVGFSLFAAGLLISAARRKDGAESAALLLGDDLRLPYGAGEDLQQPATMDDDPLTDMMINGGADIRPPPQPPATYRYSTPPTGVFTGHGHSVGGVPLTIGDNTYFNVFDPKPDLLTCDPGTTGAGGEACQECAADKYCPGGPLVRDCPPNTHSLPGSYKKSHCACAPGFYGQIGIYKKTTGCEACPPNHHCPGGKKALPCPLNSESAAGAVECKCVGGFFNNELGECQACPPGFWCPGGGLMNACPDNSNSTFGSIRVSDCSCVAGFFQPWPADDEEQGEGPHCSACYAGAYCPGGQVAVPCTSNSNSLMGSSHAGECVCVAGYFGDGGSLCQQCEQGYFCPGGKHPLECPDHSLSEAGATSVNECVCVPGYSGTNGQCTSCPAGSYCPGGDKVLHCPDKATSDAGASKCACKAGFRGSDPYACAKCPSDEYCPGDGQEAPCPANSHSRKGAASSRECACSKGFTGTGGADCTACPVNTYCPVVGGEVRNCPDHSVSDAGSSRAGQCSCTTGYYNRRGYKNALAGPDCQLCPAGFYCPDGQKKRCPAKMTSQVGSDSLDDCRCVPGHYRSGKHCEICPRGHFCIGDADKQPCPGISTSDQGAINDAQCFCAPGQYGDPKGQTGCVSCEEGYYCPGGTEQKVCPPGSMSEAGMQECRCSAGFFGANWRNCQSCPASKYCPGGRSAFSCPANSLAPPGSKSVSDCKCKARYMPVETPNTDLQCEPCSPGSYCPGDSMVMQCPAGKTSNKGANALRGCGCQAGYYDSGTVPKSNFAWVFDGKVRIENGGLYKWCVQSSDGSRLTVDGNVIVDNDGLHAVLNRCDTLQLAAGLVSVKVEGFQAVGSVVMRLKVKGPDTSNKFVYPESETFDSPTGGGVGWRVRVYASDHLLVRIPDMDTLQQLGDTDVKAVKVDEASDFDDWVAGTCAVCRKGHFCPGAFPTSSTDPKAVEIKCPGARFSKTSGAVSIGECDACRPGYMGTDWRHCTPCPVNKYCPGGDLAMHCPTGSVTIGGKKHNIRHCVCDKGYERKVGSVAPWDCDLCHKGHYCPRAGQDARVCPGNADSPRGSTSSVDCTCDPGQYDVGSSCRPCTAGYYCDGDGTRQYCGPNAGSEESSYKVDQCKADDAAVFDDEYEGTLPVCELKRCKKWWLGSLMRTCKNDKTCRGVTMEKGTFRGWGCMAVGLMSCLDDLALSTDAIPKVFYAKRRVLQEKDSVSLMRQMGLAVPECPKRAQPVVLHQYCAPHSRFRSYAWKGVLYKGSWSEISKKGCDDDERLCTDSSCNLPSNALSSVDIPRGIEVHLYSKEGFEGDEIVLYGALDADDKCLGEERRGIRGRYNWNNAVESIKVLDSDGPPPAPPPAPPPPGSPSSESGGAGSGTLLPSDWGLNEKCSTFRDHAATWRLSKQVDKLADCMMADCVQSLEAGNANKKTEVGCRFTDANGFCYHSGATQQWCAENSGDERCVDGGAQWAIPPLGRAAGVPSAWSPVANFALQGSAGATGEVVSCSCMKNCGCTVRGRTNTCYCADGTTRVAGAGPWRPASLVTKTSKVGECFCKCEAGAPVSLAKRGARDEGHQGAV